MTDFIILSFAVFTLMEAYVIAHDEIPRLPAWLSTVVATLLGLGVAWLADLSWLTGIASAGGSAILRQVGMAIYTYNLPSRRR